MHGQGTNSVQAMGGKTYASSLGVRKVQRKRERIFALPMEVGKGALQQDVLKVPKEVQAIAKPTAGVIDVAIQAALLAHGTVLSSAFCMVGAKGVNMTDARIVCPALRTTADRTVGGNDAVFLVARKAPRGRLCIA
mmetsp:Transcript_4511/g.5690  ORF Transcript_4511/g.5690 Transcript_4511/m.5690 type:complete len:136 (-) Transcript_4511:1980-2387(-)